MTIKLHLHKLICLFAGSLLLVFVLFSSFPALMNIQNAGAQLNSLQYVNPVSPDFLSLAIDLTPQLHGVNLDLSNYQSKISCDLTVPITYLGSGCMSQLQLLLPITETNLPVSQTIVEPVNYTLSPISLSIGVTSDNVTAGDTQTVTVTASNASSGNNIIGANLNLNVTDQDGGVIDQENGTTDSLGQSSFSFTVPSDASDGTFNIDVSASATGYEPTTETSTFGVISLDNSLDNSTNFDTSSGDGSSSSSDGGSSSSSDNSDFTSPTVKSTDPKDNDKNVAVDTQIAVTFSEKMDKNSIDTGSLSLVPDVGNIASISKVSVSGKSATFTVNNNLIPNMNYLATISSNVQDQNGNFLDCSGSSGVDSLCQWNFDTGTGSVKPVPPVILAPVQGSVTSNKPVISGTVVGASLVTLKIEVFDGKNSLGTTTADSNGAWSLTPNTLSEGPHTITAVAQNTNNNQKSDSSAPVTFTVCTCAITLSPISGPVGGPFTVTGTGFDPNTNVTIEFDGSSGITKSDNNGGFSVTFGVPASTGGVHTVKASEGSKSASKPFTVISSIELDPTSGPVGTSVNVKGNGFDSSSNVNLKFDSTGLTPESTDNKGTFASTFSVPSSTNGPHSVTATQGTNSDSQPFTVTASVSSTKVLGNQDNSTISVFNSSLNVSNLTNSSKSIPLNFSIATNMPETEKAHTQFSPHGGNKTSSVSEGNALHLQTSNNNTSASSSAGAKNTSVEKNMPSSTLAENNKQVQKERSQSIQQTASGVKESKVKEQLLNNKVVNISPVAKDDIVTTKQNIPLNIQVLDNDNDPNKKDTLRIIGLSPPQHGRVVSNSNGTFTYMPAPLWTGTDVFEYTITDGRGGIATSTAKVSVEPSDIKNHVPKTIAQSVSLKENTHIQVLLKAKDSDKDRLSFNIIEQPTHGKIADFSSLVGSLVYIPDSNYVGHDAFKFKANDGKVDSKGSTVSIRVMVDKHGQQIKIHKIKPNHSHDLPQSQPQLQSLQNNKSSSGPQQPDLHELKKIEDQAQNQAQDQQPPSQEGATDTKDNAEVKQQNEQISQQAASLQS